MKKWVFVFLTAALGGVAAQKPSAGPVFSLVLSAEKPAQSLASGVWVAVVWTNHSEHDLDASANVLNATNVDPNFLFDLRDDDGHPLPRRVYRFPENGGHAWFGTLKPGERMKSDADLRRLFDLKKPGKYTLQVSRRVPETLGGGTIKSNVITLTVKE